MYLKAREGGSMLGRGLRILAVLSALALIAGACGGDEEDAGGDDGTTTSASDGGGGDDGAAGEAQSGGEITIRSAYHPSIDPTIAVAFGCCGGTEVGALYDTIVRYDHETNEYVERTAESVTSNDDFTEWTVTLKPDITFTDGTPYDAEAVKFNAERHLEQPRSQDYQLLQMFLDSVEVVDELTVQFNLSQAWNGFPVVLAGPTGMIASPTAIEEAGDEYGVTGAVGAGPFKVRSFVPNERLELERNPDYYGGEVYLDGVVSVVTPSSDNPVDSIISGTLDASPVGDWEHAAAADEADFPYLNMDLIGGQLILMNGGSYVCSGGTPASLCEGVEDGTEVEMDTATSDPRVRRAVLHAVDREMFNQRFFNGAAETSLKVFPAPFAYESEAEFPAYDIEEARRLVDEAKADGWDGEIVIAGSNDPGASTGLQTFSTMLEAAGMSPVLDLRPASEYLSTIQVDRDFDVVPSFGFGQSQEKLQGAMFINLRGRYGIDSPALQDALDAVRTASTEDEVAAAWEELASAIAEDLPWGALGNSPRRWTHVPELHGVTTNANQAVALDDAWLEQ